MDTLSLSLSLRSGHRLACPAYSLHVGDKFKSEAHTHAHSSLTAPYHLHVAWQVFKYGLYTTRGLTQCTRPEYRLRCIHTPPNPPTGCEGTQGYEAIDAAWFVESGADYLKEDSCGGTQDHAGAFVQYAKMRDSLNASGRHVFFSLWWVCLLFRPLVAC